jgi:hypothetical protein
MRRLGLPVALACVDVLVALLAWRVATVLQSTWGSGHLSEISAVMLVPVLVLWLGSRALFGLYSESSVLSPPQEEFKRHTYSVLATLGALATLVLGVQLGGSLSRLLLGLFFFGLFVLAPLPRHFVKRGLSGAGA